MARDAFGEGGVGLVGEAVVVLDEVDAAAGEALGQLRPGGPAGRPWGFSAEQVRARL